MSPHSSSQPWTFSILLNALHLILQRSTFFSVCFALGLSLCSQILLRHCPWRNFRNKPVLGDALTRVSTFYRESSLRILRNAHFRREEVLHDEGQLVVSYCQVSPIDRAPQQIFQDLDIHTRSSPGLMKLKSTRPKGILAVKFIMGHDFAVIRSSPKFCCNLFWHYFRTICRTEMSNVRQIQQMIPVITCEIPFWFRCLWGGFWCRCIWFWFWSPD